MNIYSIKYRLCIILLFTISLFVPADITQSAVLSPGKFLLNDPESLTGRTELNKNERDEDDDFIDDELLLLDEENEQEASSVYDPLLYWNLAMFHLNDKLYFWGIKPIVRCYRFIAPRPVRKGFKKFFINLHTPVRMAGCIMQGKFHSAGTELLRFIINTTAGGLGFTDPAQKHLGLNLTDEDLGQTFGYYRIGNGFFIIWPLLGPSTLRDSAGFAGDLFLNPITYISPAEASAGISGFKIINNTSFTIGDYETLKSSAIDPYEALKDAYIQHRIKKIEK